VRTRLLVFHAVLAAALGVASCGGVAATIERQLRVGTAQRSYEIDLPARADHALPLPVVIVFHGGGGSADSVRRQTRMSAKGETEGFIAVYPQGSGGFAGKLRTWNAGTCCGHAMQQRVDEIAFVAALLDDLQATVAIDRARVYATGISNGGMMAYEVACALADRVAAIAVVAGEMTALDRCRPARPVSVLVIHGSADRNLPIDGGIGAKALAAHEVRSVASAIDFWRRHDGCSDDARREADGAVRRTSYPSCSGGSEVELVTIEGGAIPGRAAIASPASSIRRRRRSTRAPRSGASLRATSGARPSGNRNSACRPWRKPEIRHDQARCRTSQRPRFAPVCVPQGAQGAARERDPRAQRDRPLQPGRRRQRCRARRGLEAHQGSGEEVRRRGEGKELARDRPAVTTPSAL
jgi:polyhydroxybutyrate depolymerase